mgnify:CR=1 FL=1
MINGFLNFLAVWTGTQQKISAAFGNKDKKETKYGSEKKDAIVNVAETVNENTQDAIIGLTYGTFDIVDIKSTKVAQKSVEATLLTNGASSEVTVPLATGASIVSVFSKGVKTFILGIKGYSNEAKGEATDAGIKAISIYVGVKFLRRQTISQELYIKVY